MKIILYKDVPNLGEEGDVKVVADGYARNYLIPKKFAVRYTKATEVELAQKQQAIQRRRQEKLNAAADAKTRIESLVMELSVAAGENGKLFGSVTTAAIADFLQAQGIQVERKRIELPSGGIKMLGKHSVQIKLYGGGDAVLTVNVTPPADKEEAGKTEKPTEESAASSEEAAQSPEKAEAAESADENQDSEEASSSAENEPAGEESAEVES